VDALGWLELSTLIPFVVHMGNHLDEWILQEAKESSLLDETDIIAPSVKIHKENLAWKILSVLNHIGFMRKLFKRLYVNLFELYSFEKK
jgi:hypothetical protein